MWPTGSLRSSTSHGRLVIGHNRDRSVPSRGHHVHQTFTFPSTVWPADLCESSQGDPDCSPLPRGCTKQSEPGPPGPHNPPGGRQALPGMPSWAATEEAGSPPLLLTASHPGGGRGCASLMSTRTLPPSWACVSPAELNLWAGLPPACAATTTGCAGRDPRPLHPPPPPHPRRGSCVLFVRGECPYLTQASLSPRWWHHCAWC